MIASLLILLTLTTTSTPDPRPEIVIFTYDSMIARGGLGEIIFPLFEAKCGCRVKVNASGDAVQILSRLEIAIQTKQRLPDVLLGIDQILWDRAKSYALPWGKWKPMGYESIKAEAIVGEGFLPFDLGYFSWIADEELLKEKSLEAPKKLSDLLTPQWKRNFILEDPQTSTPGLGFLLLTQKLRGPDYLNFWSKLKTQWLALLPGWDAAYGIFLKKEAPLVWSYTTSEAYHRNHGDGEKYKAHLVEEIAPLEIEGAMIVNGTKSERLAKDFLEFILSKPVQEAIPLHQWMLPSCRGLQLPKEFQHLPMPRSPFKLSVSDKELKQLMKDWHLAISAP